MVVNVAGYVGVSLVAPPSASARGGTKSLVETPEPAVPPALWRGRASVGELWALVEKFLGPGAEKAARAQAHGMGLEAPSTTQAGPELIRYVEELLVGAVGAACARLMIASVVEHEPLRVRFDTVAEFLDQASHVAVLEERSRLARELHDTVCQALFSMTLQSRALELAVQRTCQDPDGRIGGGLTELRELTQTALAEMRTLLFQLRPSALHEQGLATAVQQHAAAVAAREGLDIRVHAPAKRLLLDELAEYELFRIIQEALHNSLKHADPQRVDIRLTQDAGPAGGLTVEVADDGVGFDTRALHPGHIGLECMRERAERLGGRLIVDSCPTGTTIRAVLPGSLDPRVEVSPPTKPAVQGK
jgi:signal transduction histidine kinase